MKTYNTIILIQEVKLKIQNIHIFATNNPCCYLIIMLSARFSIPIKVYNNSVYF